MSVMHIAGFDANDVVNGEGTCVSIFLSGCPLRCTNCHNPEAWDSNYGIKKWTSEVIETIKNALTANNIQRNLSILGGEPLWHGNGNDENVAAIVQEVKQNCPNAKIFLWTGYTWEKLITNPFIFACVLPYIDVLIDGPYVQEERDVTLWLRGSRKQRIIDVQESLKAKEVKLYTK